MKLTNEDLIDKADTVEEKDFWSALVELRAKEIQIKEMHNDSECLYNMNKNQYKYTFNFLFLRYFCYIKMDESYIKGYRYEI